MPERLTLTVLQKIREMEERQLVTALIQTVNSNHPYKEEMVKMIVEYGGETYGIGFEGYLELTYLPLEMLS